MTADVGRTFRKRLLAGDTLVGTWVKTPSMTIVELLALSGLDVCCLDAEHAPFDRRDLDQCLFVGRQAGLPLIVRVADAAPSTLLNALDLGASGVLAPHVTSGDTAASLVRNCRFGPGGRGYAGSTRAAGYTTRPMRSYLAGSGHESAVIAQIEDKEALDAIDEIAAVDNLDALFIGRMDLAVSMGFDNPAAAPVIEAMEHICGTATRHGRRLGMFLAKADEMPVWQKLGVSLFLIGSDQSFVLTGARSLAAAKTG